MNFLSRPTRKEREYRRVRALDNRFEEKAKKAWLAIESDPRPNSQKGQLYARWGVWKEAAEMVRGEQ